MRKITILCFLLMSSFFVKAQSFIGFLTDNYSGVNSVIANPANIADSRFKADINLAGASAYVANNYYGVNVFDAMKSGYDIDASANTYPLTTGSAMFNVDVMGPSFMISMTPKASIALFSRARTFFNVTDANTNSLDFIDTRNSFFIDEGNIEYVSQSWAEIGLTYARVLMDDGANFLKGGISVKYLQGIASSYAYATDLTVDYNSVSNVMNTTGQLDLGYTDRNLFVGDNYKNYEYNSVPNAKHLGLDFGFVYEWRPNYQEYVKTNSNGDKAVANDVNKYKLKLGLSVTDYGSMFYKDAQSAQYDVNRNNLPEVNGLHDFDVILDNLYPNKTTDTGYKTKLPTAAHFNADWNFNDKIYLNLNTDFSLVKQGKRKTSAIANMVSITPRYESKWFSFYLPLNVNTTQESYTAGAGFRAGFLYLGSGSIISALVSDNSKSADVYAGLKVPIFHAALKDKDADGIVDKIDSCPEEAGPEENNGCPWGDADLDTVLDNVDKCPEVAGPAVNDGCPWGDTDEDTVFDNIDKCPDVAGPVANFGCPWPDTDGDSVLDKDDYCVYIPGSVDNNGCPELTVEVQKSLNDYAKTILFNSGKATIKEESEQVLNEIVRILNEYPNSNFSIEGHTDSIGNATLNQELSESRAGSVMRFLIENGISPARLSSRGFGESVPMADNKTASGRALNRRVEINLDK